MYAAAEVVVEGGQGKLVVTEQIVLGPVQLFMKFMILKAMELTSMLVLAMVHLLVKSGVILPLPQLGL